jgi:hypothetical protein
MTNVINIIADAHRMADMNLTAQRYSKARDSFVWLSLEAGEYVMQDQRTGSVHTLDVDFTSRERLAAHWAGFCAIHNAH